MPTRYTTKIEQITIRRAINGLIVTVTKDSVEWVPAEEYVYSNISDVIDAISRIYEENA